VRAALLVAPGDVEQPALRHALPSWSPLLQHPLPFRSLLLGSHDDPYCSLERAQWMAQCWGAAFIDCGQSGHINADSGLGDWDEGLRLLGELSAGAEPNH
jgi:predicted alpha/beta hydrolase family esterase